MQPNMDTAIKTMRSLLNTSKDGLLEKQLRRDFREMEGCEIPYKSFGYNTLLDFLRASNEFDMYSTNDGMQIRARVSQSSQHIVDLVESQNRVRKKSTKSMPFVPRFNAQGYRRPTTVNGRYNSQQPQRRQQNSQYFANTTNRSNNNYGNSNNYTRNSSQTASMASNQKKNENWDMNVNRLQQFQPIDYQLLQNRIKQVQLQNIIATNTAIVQAQAQAARAQVQAQAQEFARLQLEQVKAQVKMKLNSINANAVANAASSMPKSDVNARLNPTFQSNQNGGSRNTVPVEMKSNLRATASASVTQNQCHKEEADSDWDNEPSNVIDLTKSSTENICTQSNSQNRLQQQMNGTTEKWKHDLYNPNQKASKPCAINEVHNNATKKSVAPNHTTSSQIDVKNATTDQEKNISSLWLNYGTKPNEPVKKPPVFDRLGPKVTDDKQPIQSRLLVTPPPTKEKPTDTVDFVMQQQQQQPAYNNPFHSNVTATIEQKTPPKAVANEKFEKKSVKGSSSKEMLEIYCKEKNFDAPIFECRSSRFKKIIGTVCVEGVKYSTEPIEYENEVRAENAVAAKALECFWREFPIARDSCDSIARKIYDCIGDNGVFLKYLPNIFEQKYEESLPDGWTDIIENRPEMFSIQQQATHLSIVFKKALINLEVKFSTTHGMDSMKSQSTKSLTSSTPIERNDTHANPTVPKLDVNELPVMKLPWNEPYWKILITSATSSIDVWGRNLDSEDWDDLDEALGCIEDEFLSDLTRPSPCPEHKIIVGDLYMAVHKMPSEEMYKKFDYHAYRVRVEEINRVKKQALCFYIDDGYTEWLEYESNLFHLNRHLWKYSAQAIRFSLYNVQDFAENSFACEEIRKQLLSNTPFVATVKTKQHEFEDQLEKMDSTAQISVILYDTSTDEDRNVNKDVLQKICSQLQPPQLNPRNTNIVSITHVCDNGDVFCRLYGSKEMQLIQRILDRIIKTFDIEKYHVDSEQLWNTSGKIKLHLIYDKISQRYYRAIILPTQSKQPTVMCRCVDYGFTKCISYNDIYDLTRLSIALSNYPHQAILVQLNGIESGGEYPADGIQRMRDLLVTHKPVYLDIVVRSEFPIVEVRKVIDGQEYPLNGAIQLALKISSDAVSVPEYDDSFSSGERENDQCGHLELHPKPKIGQSYISTVTAASNPSHFYIQLSSNDYIKLTNDLRKDCESSEEKLSKNEVKLNHLYAAQFQDGYWHRVKVQAFSTNETVKVQKWDYGDMEYCSIDALRPLSNKFLKLPQMVFCARLHDLQPRENVWNEDDCARFHELTVGKIFHIQIKDIRRIGDNNYVAELILARPDRSNIGEILIRENRAI